MKNFKFNKVQQVQHLTVVYKMIFQKCKVFGGDPSRGCVKVVGGKGGLLYNTYLLRVLCAIPTFLLR